MDKTANLKKLMKQRQDARIEGLGWLGRQSRAVNSRYVELRQVHDILGALAIVRAEVAEGSLR